MDRQIKTEKAWLIPYRIYQRLSNKFRMEIPRNLSKRDVAHLMPKPEPLHRFVKTMSGLFYSAIRKILWKYEGKAALIWSGRPSSAEVVYRFLEFKGVGLKIASMATNILARDLKIPFADYSSIDILADAYVCRVFGHLGLCPSNANAEQVTYKARAPHPEFPGVIDLPCLEIGQKWCKPSVPECRKCHMNDLCPAARPAK
jgi:endonuclease III